MTTHDFFYKLQIATHHNVDEERLVYILEFNFEICKKMINCIDMLHCIESDS